MTPFEFKITTQIIYGRGCAQQLGEISAKNNIKKALVVTDEGVAKSGLLDKVLPVLNDAGIATDIFDQVEVNPTVETVEKAYAQLQKSNCDGVIAIGGGSPIDAGKAVGVLMGNGGAVSDYLGIDKVPSPSGPVICVPDHRRHGR